MDFLAQLNPNSLRIAESSLERQGFPTVLPLEEETRQRGGIFVTGDRPLLPGYIFVALDVTRGHWRAINSTSGITRLVSFGKEPAPVPLELVSQLLLRFIPPGKRVPPKLLRPRDQVRVTKGAFADFVAEIESIAPDRRVWVLLEIKVGRARVSGGATRCGPCRFCAGNSNSIGF